MRTGGFSQGFERAASEAKRGADKIQREANRATSGLSATLSKLRSQLNLLSTFTAGFVSVQAIRSIVNTADEYQRLEGRLKLVTSSARELADVQQQLFGVAQRTRTEIQGVTELYVRLGLTAKELGASQSDLLKFTEAVNNALTLSGTSVQSARGALTQLAQGMGGVTFRAEEFNSVLEAMPVFLQAMAKHVKGTNGSLIQLRDLVQKGKLFSRDAFEAGIAAAEELKQKFDLLPTTIQGAATQLKNAFFTAVGQESNIKPIVDALKDLAKVISDPAFQRDFGAFVNGIIKLAGYGVQAAAGIGKVVTAVRENFEIATGELSAYEVNLVFIKRLRDTLEADSWAKKDLLFIGMSNEALREQIRLLEEANQKLRHGPQRPMALIRGRPTPTEVVTPIDTDAAKEAERAREAILNQIQALEQQRAVIGKTAEEVMRYRVTQGDLAETLKKSGLPLKEFQQRFIDLAVAIEQATSVESIEEQIKALQDQTATYGMSEEAAFEYSLTHGKLAEQLDKTKDAQARLTDELRQAWRELQHAKDIQKITQGMADIERELLEAAGQTAEAARLAAEADVKELREAIEREMGTAQTAVENAKQAIGEPIEAKVTVDSAGIETVLVEASKQGQAILDAHALELRIQASIEIKVNRAETEKIQNEIERIRTEFGRQEQTIEARVETGDLSRITAHRELIKVHQREAAVLRQKYDAYLKQIEVVKQLVEATKADPVANAAAVARLRELTAQAEELGFTIEDLMRTTNEFKKVFADAFETGMGDALSDLVLGVKSLGEAVEGFFRGINEELVKWASQQVSAAIREKVFGKGGMLGGLGDIIGREQPWKIENLVGGGGLQEIAVTAQKIPEAGIDAAALTTASASLTTAAGVLGPAMASSAGFLTTAAQALTQAAQALAASSASGAGGSALAGLFGGSSGGGGLEPIIVTAQRVPEWVAEGGLIRGPGTGTSDSIPAMLSNREYVMPARVVTQPGMYDLLEKMRRGFKPQHFAEGGLVSVNAHAGPSMPTWQADPLAAKGVTQYITNQFTFEQPQSRATQMQVGAAAARGLKRADIKNN